MPHFLSLWTFIMHLIIYLFLRLNSSVLNVVKLQCRKLWGVVNFEVVNFEVVNFNVVNFEVVRKLRGRKLWWVVNFKVVNFNVVNFEVVNFEVVNFKLVILADFLTSTYCNLKRFVFLLKVLYNILYCILTHK